MNTLQGKTALITGGGSGIGLAVARTFLEHGVRVAITGRNGEKLRQATASLQGGDRLIYQSADVADLAQVQSLVTKVNSVFGTIDILVNNAGLNVKERTFRELTPENWSLLLAGNLTGA